MAIAQVQIGTGAAGTTTAKVTWSPNTTSGNALFVVVTASSVGGNPAITPPSGFVEAKTRTGSLLRTSLYYYENCASQADTGNFTISGTNPRITVTGVEMSGLATSSSIDVTASNSGATGNLDSGTTGATAQAAEYVIAGMGELIQTSFSAPTNGFTITSQLQGNLNQTNGLVDKIVAATGTQNTGVTTASGSTEWTAVIASFKAAAGGTTFTRTASDKIGFQDARSRTATCLRSRSDNLGMRDALSRLATSKRSRADNIGMRDLTQRLQSALRSRSDNIGMRDAIAYRELFARRVVEALGIQDTTKRNAVLKRLLADNVGFRDIASDREIIGAAQHYLSLLFAAGS